MRGRRRARSREAPDARAAVVAARDDKLVPESDGGDLDEV